MAIVLETTAEGATGFAVGVSQAVNFGTNADRWAMLAIAHIATLNGTAPTIGGTSMNALYGNATTGIVSVWELKGIGSGSQTVAFTGDSTNDFCWAVVGYSGVDQTTPYDGYQEDTTNNDPSVTVTSTTGNVVVGGSVFTDYTGGAHTAGAGQLTNDYSPDTTANNCHIMMSDEAGAASVTHSYTRSGGTYSNKVGWGLNLRAASGGGGAATAAHRAAALRGFLRGLGRGFVTTRSGLWRPRDRRIIIPVGIELQGI